MPEITRKIELKKYRPEFGDGYIVIAEPGTDAFIDLLKLKELNDAESVMKKSSEWLADSMRECWLVNGDGVLVAVDKDYISTRFPAATVANILKDLLTPDPL